jgi:hypothetical protein
MRAILLMASILTLSAQQAPPPPADAKPADAKPAATPTDTKLPDATPADGKPAEAKPADAPPADTTAPDPAAPQASAPAPAPAAGGQAATISPRPSSEPWLTGYIDFGYRYLTGVGGSFETYRSIVNLGSGPKLLALDFTVLDPKRRLFDVAHVRAFTWFGEPYSTFHLDAKKHRIYEFNADYRDIAYFNNMPSFANPLLAQGILLNQQAFDTRYKIAHLELDLLPGRWITPYVGYDANSQSGNGVTVFVASRNEYPVPTNLNDHTNVYRGGVRIGRSRFHGTIEVGGTTFKDDQQVFWNDGTNFGNVSTPVQGQTLFLSGLAAAYGIRGDGVFTKALLQGSVTSWLDLTGQFLYTQPQTTTNFQQSASGNFFLQSQLLFYTGQQNLVAAQAKMPHTSGSFDAEIRPFRRARIIESWYTDRLHTSGNAASSQVVIGSGTPQQMSALLASSLATNYSQVEMDVLFDVTSRLTLRGGYRYAWGDGTNVTLPLAGLVGLERATLRRNAGIGAVSYQPMQKLSITGDIEAALSGNVYFRTSLYNYQRVRARARYQATSKLNLAVDFNVLNNQNPTPGINYNYLALQQSLSVAWTPESKAWDFQGTYTRFAEQSNIFYLIPQTLQPAPSFYRNNAHTITALFHRRFRPIAAGQKPELMAGGAVFLSSGSRPSTYFQPLTRFTAPFTKNLASFLEWRYYGYGEAFYIYEGFRAHLITVGLRWTQ